MVNLGLINLFKPFIGHHDWNGVFYSNIARNYLRLGLIASKLGQVTDFGLIGTPENFYTHYPPLLTLIMAGWFKLVGIGDWQARLVPFIFSLGSLGLLWRLKPIAAVLAVALTPMWRYFSVMPSQEALIIFFSLLSVSALLKNQKKLFYFSVIANGLSGWAGYFLYPWLWLLNKNRPWLIKASLILVLIFGLHLSHVYWLTGSVSGGGLIDALKLRLNLAGTEGFTWLKYLILEKQRLGAFFTLTLLGAAGISTIWRRDRLVLAFLGWGISYPLIFSNVVFIHDYFNIFFIPWLALGAAGLFPKKSFLAILFLALVFWERQFFYRALDRSDSFRPGYELGQKINNLVPLGETVYVIGAKDFIEPQNLFISYYADREVIYLTADESLPNGAKYVFNEAE